MLTGLKFHEKLLEECTKTQRKLEIMGCPKLSHILQDLKCVVLSS